MGATDEWLTNLREKNAAKLGTALSYDKVKPEQAAEAEHVGKALGVPSAVVSSQPDVFKRQLDQKKFTESLKGAPATASWLRDMQNGALAKDDLDNLTWFERELKPFASTGSADGPFGVVSGVGRAIGRGARRTTAIPYEGGARVDAQTVGDFGKTQDEIYQSIIGEWDNPSPETLATARQTAQLRFETVEGLTDAQRADVLSQGADDLAKSREILDKAASVAMSEGAAQFRDTTLANAENTVTGALSAFAADPVGGAAFLVETAAEFLPMMAAATGVTIATRSPGLGAVAMGVGSGLTENTTGAMEFLAEGGVDLSTPDAALAVLENAELMQAAADRGLTRGLIIGLMDAASGGVAGQTLMQSPAGEMVAQGLAQVMFGAGGEGIAQAASGQEIDWRDIVIEGLAELVTAPVEVLGVGGRGVLRKLEKGANETALPETLDKIDGMAAASKLKQRSPDKFAEAVGRQELGEVYVPADKLREFFQAKDMTGEEWGFDPEYLGEQALAGAHVPLPLSTYASTISGTDSADWVRNNAVFDPDEMSASEAAEFNAQVQDILQEAREEVAAAVEEDRAIRSADVQIYDSVFSQLRAAGRSPDVAGHEARVMAAFWRTMGERYGEDPLDLAKSMGLRIQGPQTPELARRRGDLDIRLNALRADAAKALKPYGGSLVDFVIGEGGIQDVGGDVASFELPKGVVSETREEIEARRAQPTMAGMPSLGKGLGLDEMARRAREAGYLDTEDTNALLEALGSKEPVYLEGEGVDPGMAALADELSRRGIDLSELSNDDVAAMLDDGDGREFWQDEIDLESLIQFADESIAADGQDVQPIGKLDVYPAAIPPEYEFSNFRDAGGKISEMSPDEFINLSSALSVDEDTMENASDLARMMLSGREIDPPRLSVSTDGRVDSHDGRHRALAAKMLGIKRIPVLLMGDGGTAYPDGVVELKAQNGSRDYDFALPMRSRRLFQTAPATDSAAFRNWFGDSKVVDENGDPLVVYHGTRSDISRDDFQFKPELIGSATDGGHYGSGFYFTPNKGEAEYYGGNVAAVYLSIQNPLDLSNTTGDYTFIGHFKSFGPKLDSIGALSEDQKRALTATLAADAYVVDNVKFVRAVARDGTEGWSAKVANPAEGFTDEIHMRPMMRGAWPETKEEALHRLQSDFRSEMERFHKEAFPGLGEEAASLSDYVRTDLGPDALTAAAKSAGYDGIVYGDEYVAFSPTQIKSVNNRGTFDADDPRILYQPAYHGSPHIFDKFSTAHMGTGEGAQAFGWGMYFAGRKGVADYYRRYLTGQEGADRTLQYADGSDVDILDWPSGISDLWFDSDSSVSHDELVERAESAIDDAKTRLRNKELRDARVRRHQETLDFLKANPGVNLGSVKKGRLYKVDIPEDSDLMEWDVPLSEQSGKVKTALQSIEASTRDSSVNFDGLRNAGFNIQKIDGLENATRTALVLSDRRANTGVALYDALSSDLGSPEQASLALNAAGIPGHRFLDQGSRENGEGTYNYVIYNDDAVRVLEFEQTKRGSIVLPSGGLQSGETVINLFEQANLSTFLHESSHYFLEAFTALADSPNAPEAMRKDMATIREWLGNDGGPFTTEQHEQWARGGEAYFMEGKAPSLDLADAFARFKSWLTRVYRSIKGLNVKITPEIREVMDRMLATDAEISEARAEMEMRPLFKEAPAGMSKVDFQTYQRMAQRSADQAEQRLIDKTMAKVRRERETWYKDEKKAVRKEVEASVNKQREYRLTEALSNRRWFDADGETTEMPDMRMDRQGLIDLFGEGVLKEIDKSRFGGKYAIYKKDGDDPRSVAEFFGFKSASEMLDVLQNTPKRKDAIDAEVERVMTERHGDPLNDGTIEEEALRAIHNDQQANTVVAEVRHLAGQIGRKTTNLSARIYRHRARAMLGRMTVKDAAKPHVFLSAERRAADNAQRAFAKVARGGGEAALAEAYQAKEQQLLNHMLYNEAKDFEAKLQRGREKMRSYSKKSVREKLAGGYIEQIDDLLERFDFRKRSPGQVARTESLQEYITRMEADGREAELAIDQRLLDEAKRTHYTRLTVEEFNGLTDTIANIDHMGRFKQNLIERNRKRKLAESASNVEGAIRKSQKASDRRDSSRGMQALNLIRRPDTIMIDLDGGKEMGPVYDELKRGIDEGQAEEQKAQVKMAEDFDALFNGHYSRKELRAMVESKAIPGVNAREWSKQEILSLALNMGAEENHQRVLDRNVDPEMLIDPETLHNLLSTLDENDWRFVQGMWDMVNSYWPELAAVHKRRTGVEPDKVQAKLMYDGAPDFVRGGYYPIKYDAARGASAAKDEQSAWDKFLTAGHGSTAAVKNGMTKQRQKTGGGRTIKYDLNVPFQHLRETVRYIALSEAVDNAYRILQHEDVVRAFQDTGNADTLKTLNLWVKDTAQGPIFNTDLLNSTARLVKNNFTLSKLAFNLKTVILQATGIGQSAATIGKMNMARGYLAYMKRPHLMIADVTQKSALMAERQTTFQKDIFDFINDVKVQSPLAGKWSRAKKVTAQVGFWPMIKMQFLVVDMPTWIGAYDAGLRKYKGDDAKAVHYADRMVVRAQDSGLFADRAAVERGTVSENVRQADFIRLFTTLGGYMLTKLNRMNVTAKQTVLGVSEADTAAKKTAAAFSGAVDMMLLLMFEPMLMALIYSLASDDDEPEDVAKFIAVEMGMATVGGIPVVRDMASAARGYGGGGVYGSVLEMPYRAGVQAMQGEMDSAFVKAMGDVFGVATGLPTTAFTRAVSPIFDEDASTAEVLMGRNPLAD